MPGGKVSTTKAKRTRLLAQLTKIFEFTKTLNVETQADEFTVRCNKIEDLSDKFEETNQDLLDLEIEKNPADENVKKVSEEYAQKSEEFEDMYTAIMVKLDICKRHIQNTAQNAAAAKRTAAVKLPKLDIKRFDGSLSQWVIFYENFNALIHENEGLSPVEKFHYLLTSLSGPALSIAKNLPITAENYAVVWNNLKLQYDDKRVLAAHYLDTICDLPNLSGNSASAVKQLLSSLKDSKEALTCLKFKQLDDFILLHLGLKKLPPYIRKQFENQRHLKVTTDLPTYKDLLDFLTQLAKVNELSNPQEKKQENQNSRSEAPKKVLFGNESRNKNSENKKAACPVCKKDHGLFACDEFKKLSVSDRVERLNSLRRCLNCLGPNHCAKDCKKPYRCAQCKRRHNSLIHNYYDQNDTSSRGKESDRSSSENSVNMASRDITPHLKDHSTLLGSAIIEVKDGFGNYQIVRVIIDSAAMSTFITEECLKRLKLTVSRDYSNYAGLGESAIQQKGVVKCCLKPRNKSRPLLYPEAVVVELITNELPSTRVHAEVQNTWKNLDLADPTYFTPSKVDMLIGAEFFPYIYTGKKKLTYSKACALESIYGWVITGRIPSNLKISKKSNFVIIDDVFKNDLTRFWQVEEPDHKPAINPDDEICEELYKKLHYREASGRYVVPMLLKSEAPVLPNSFNSALNRLKTVERKLCRQPELQKAYAKHIQEYVDLGHMEEVKDVGSAACYIPHQMVVRKTEAGAKYRVVFDASMNIAGSGITLNQILHTGPKLQANIVQIIIRFRSHAVALTTDISKMFRQILIRKEDRKYQHAIWREHVDDPIQDFELRTVTQGTASAPYLAGRTMVQLAEDEKQDFPRASLVIKRDRVVDDILTGGDSVADTISLRSQLTPMCKRGMFDLVKWSSSHPEVLEGLESNERAIPINLCPESETNSPSHGLLGLNWTPKSDQFSYNPVEFSNKFTKRVILSNISRLFDPLGWVTPVVLAAKIIIQKLWIAGVDWDEPIPPEIADAWLQIFNQLPLLNKLQIPRMIFNSKNKVAVLVGFSDGSERAFGASIFLRVPTESGFDSNLLIAKSKVAPVKPLSVPRLELNGALLLTRIFSVAVQALETTDYKIERIIAITDSTTNLNWFTTPAFMLKPYVANRVVSITDQIPADHWFHCKSEFNPSDRASRGLLPQQLVNNTFWFKGPTWLTKDIAEWPISTIKHDQQLQVPELRPSKKVFVAQNDQFTLIDRFSSFFKLQRVTAWCFRFYFNCRKRIQQKKGENVEKSSGALTLDELNHTLNQIVKIVQKRAFQDDLENLKNGKKLNPNLASLNPFLDPHGVLRVGGRLVHSTLSYDAKHPIILPKNENFTRLIIWHFHHLYLHSGPKLLQSIITQKFWIISARNAIRSQLHKCIKCFRASPKNPTPQMGNLPKCRVIPARCFLKCGVDYAGPVYLKLGGRRNSSSVKAYICLFVCLTTKAVHLELVSDLTADAFLAAATRFISRRGLCQEIFSDCGKNFIGAKNQLTEIFQHLQLQENREKIQKKLAERGIKWSFNPPYGPHFGGIWESGVKSVKYHLTRVIGEQKLTFEEYSTVLAKIEAILNSRPLCAVSADIEEIDALTPAHFLVGGPLLSLPEYDWEGERVNRLSRWQLLQQITQQFWRRWSQEYLNLLQQRYKWKTNEKNASLSVGDLVVLKDDNTAPLLWSTGRVTKLHPGTDGITRVATVKTPSGIYIRPIVKLCPLPLD